MNTDDNAIVNLSLDMSEEDIEEATAYEPCDEYPFTDDHRYNFNLVLRNLDL